MFSFLFTKIKHNQDPRLVSKKKIDFFLFSAANVGIQHMHAPKHTVFNTEIIEA